MKILQINKFFYLKGGSEKYLFLLSKYLEDFGHSVIHFSMDDQENSPSTTSDFFVSPFWSSKQSLFPQWLFHDPFRPLYCLEAKRKIKQLIIKEKPDIAHIHNISFYLSGSILSALKEMAVPFVWTLHDYSLIAPNFTMSCSDFECPHLIPGAILQWKTALHRCYDHRFLKTAVAVFELFALHKYLNPFESTRFFICPSLFIKKKFSDWGVKEEKLIHLPLPIEWKTKQETRHPKGFLFVGRLVKGKGIMTLLALSRKQRIPLTIIGSGPLECWVRKQMVNSPWIQFHRSIPNFELPNYFQQAFAVIVPSQWPDNQPYVILEAMANHCPVLASNIGGIPELVHHGKTGLLFQPGNMREMSNAIGAVRVNPRLCQELSDNAFSFVSAICDPYRHVEKILSFYEHILGSQ